jgi:dihydropteroate synthase
MGIVNLTPDSFSDGGEARTWDAIEVRIDRMIASGVHILDFGAESTRPGASALTPAEEWSRLSPVLDKTIAKLADDRLRPQISVDTYHPEVARKALRLGVDIINDVGGLTAPAMLEIASESAATFVAMHNLGLPADPKITLDTARSAVEQVQEWLDRQIELWLRSELDLNRVVFDPGVGFGKNSLQSLELLKGVDRFRDCGFRVLIGHSRKSFLKSLAGDSVSDRDLATIGSSMALGNRSVDIFRVHNVPDHVAAYRGWAQMQAPDPQS